MLINDMLNKLYITRTDKYELFLDMYQLPEHVSFDEIIYDVVESNPLSSLRYTHHVVCNSTYDGIDLSNIKVLTVRGSSWANFEFPICLVTLTIETGAHIVRLPSLKYLRVKCPELDLSRSFHVSECENLETLICTNVTHLVISHLNNTVISSTDSLLHVDFSSHLNKTCSNITLHNCSGVSYHKIETITLVFDDRRSNLYFLMCGVCTDLTIIHNGDNQLQILLDRPFRIENLHFIKNGRTLDVQSYLKLPLFLDTDNFRISVDCSSYKKIEHLLSDIHSRNKAIKKYTLNLPCASFVIIN